jgi:hypothetical protein
MAAACLVLSGPCVVPAGVFAAGIACQAAAAAFSVANAAGEENAAFDWQQHAWDSGFEYVHTDGKLVAKYGEHVCLRACVGVGVPFSHGFTAE